MQKESAKHEEKPSFEEKTRFLLHDNILNCSGEGRGYLMKQMMVMLILTLLVSSVGAEIFRDNFNDGDLKGWTFVEGDEDGSIQNGELVFSSPKAEAKAEVMIAVDGIVASDYEVSVSIKISRLARDILVKGINGGAAIGLRAHTDPLLERFQGNKKLLTLMYKRSYNFFLGYQEINIDDIRRGLAATIQHMDVEANGRNELNVMLKGNLRAFRLFDFRLHKWYRLKVIAKGNRFQCFIDETEMLDFFDDTYKAGRIYLSSGLGNRVHFDDFEVQYEARSVQPREKLTTTWGEIKSDFH